MLILSHVGRCLDPRVIRFGRGARPADCNPRQSNFHEAQIVRADDGKDHVEYELLVVNVSSEPVTLASVAVFDPPEKNSCGS